MRQPSFLRTRARWSRTGFTLVEVIVAIVLIEIGLLALTASSAIVIRETLFARARIAALEIARNRVESLASAPCVSTAGSVAGPSGFQEDWSVRLAPVSAREIRDSVTFTLQRATRAVVFQTRTPCGP